MVRQMKQCPTCHFTFADFQRVCTFDGAELVPYEKPQSLIKVPEPPPRPRLKPSMSLTSLAVLVVFLSAVLIGYLKSPNPSIPAVVVQQQAHDSASSTIRTGRITEEFTAEPKVTARATRVRSKLKRRVPAYRVAATLNRAGNRPPNVIAQQRTAQQTTRDKSPKVVAILKTTWKVLKKPFDF